LTLTPLKSQSSKNRKSKLSGVSVNLQKQLGEANELLEQDESVFGQRQREREIEVEEARIEFLKSKCSRLTNSSNYQCNPCNKRSIKAGLRGFERIWNNIQTFHTGPVMAGLRPSSGSN
jgi:hypothetical protein